MARCLQAKFTTLRSDRISRIGLLHFNLDKRAIGRPQTTAWFFDSWGGEALFKDHERSEMGQALRKIGEPTVIACRLPLNAALHTAPPLGQMFWDAVYADDPEQVGGQGRISVEVQPADIELVAGPGEAFFDRYCASSSGHS